MKNEGYRKYFLLKHCKAVYKVIADDYFDECKILPTEFITTCNKDHNILKFIPKAVKKEIHKISLDQGMFSQVFVIRRKNTINENPKSSK